MRSELRAMAITPSGWPSAGIKDPGTRVGARQLSGGGGPDGAWLFAAGALLSWGATPWNPRWPTARFLRHQAGAVLTRGATPEPPHGLRPGSSVTRPGPC